ncbi:DUF6493 family protein [Spirillospora sp. NPDC047279]|uniref:DUF6493 family protein n=1 Tax=Spirillospora sp. NPDC047279 TaxID=3155478 RepID=UPI0033EAF748
MNAREVLDGWVARPAPEVIRLARALAPAERREVAAELPRYLRDRLGSPAFRWPDSDRTVRLLVAGAATIGGAAGVARWVWRRELRSAAWSDSSGQARSRLVRAAVADRPDAWRSDLAHRLAGRLRTSGDSWQEAPLWILAAELIRDLGEQPPVTPAFVTGWTAWGATLSRLEDDPFLDALLPRLFEVDGLGGALTWDRTLVGLAREGRVERAALLDGCAGRFLRGGRVTDLRWFVRLYEALEPSVDEAAARMRDLVRLLPTAPAPVAELALREIRRVDAERPLDPDLFAEASGALLFRPEKKLVRATLIWLDRTARKHDRAGATLDALAAVLDADDLDARERARATAAKLGATVTADAPAGDPAPPGPPPFVPRELPAPIATPTELIEALSAVMAPGRGEAAYGDLERVMAGVVECVHRDPGGTREALLRLAPDGARDRHRRIVGESPAAWAARAAQRILTSAPSFGLRTVLDTLRRERPWTDALSVPPPVLFLRWRMREVPSLVGRAPLLLATPTAASGHVDPGVLVSRLRSFEEAGLLAPHADLHQALLRVPRDIGAEAVKAAAELRSPAGRVLAAWLAAGGLPDPRVTCEPLKLPPKYHRGPYDDRFPTKSLATVRPAPGADVPEPISHLVRLPTGDAWTHHPEYAFRSGLSGWPALMPSHREVIAGHLATYLAGSEDEPDELGAALLALAEADGPTGAATGTVLARGLSATARTARAGSVDAFLTFSARGRLPAAELGTAIPALAGQGIVKVNRVTEALDEAARAGGHADVWATLATALPRLFPAPGERAATGLADLVALATRSAETLGVRTGLPGLADLAARGGGSRVAKEAVRLHRTLTETTG